MRIERSVTTISWIPSEAIPGVTKLPFEVGVGHFDDPPPDHVGAEEIDGLRRADRFRFANVLRGWVEVEDGRIVHHGQAGGGRIGATTMRFGGRSVTFAATAFPDITPDPRSATVGCAFVRRREVGRGCRPPDESSVPVRADQGTIGLDLLELTIHADGRSEHRLAGATPFRHWVYDTEGTSARNRAGSASGVGTTGRSGSTPRGGARTSEAVVAAVETALERELSTTIMRGREA